MHILTPQNHPLQPHYTPQITEHALRSKLIITSYGNDGCNVNIVSYPTS